MNSISIEGDSIWMKEEEIVRLIDSGKISFSRKIGSTNKVKTVSKTKEEERTREKQQLFGRKESPQPERRSQREKSNKFNLSLNPIAFNR